MDVVQLERRIESDVAEGHVPLIVIGTAGSVSTGAIDPLRDIARVCREKGIWFHVDGAYGAIAAAVPGVPDQLRALAEADSVAVDPHKWLYAPLEAGCAIVRDAAALRAAFSYHPAYYHLGEHGINYVDYGPQNSRGFRALKVWLSLKHAGAAAYRKTVADDMALSRVMAAAVTRDSELQLVTQSLSITTFRFVPADLKPLVGDKRTEEYLNRLNESLLEVIQRGGEAFVSNAVVGGRMVLRACIVNFRTTQEDVEAIPGIVVRVGRGLDAHMRQTALR
jgi:glutamate/tyrosine decarboxylase-like PLP-dependent enzyme